MPVAGWKRAESMGVSARRGTLAAVRRLAAETAVVADDGLVMGLAAVVSVETKLPALECVLVRAVELSAAVTVKPCAPRQTATLAAGTLLAGTLPPMGLKGIA